MSFQTSNKFKELVSLNYGPSLRSSNYTGVNNYRFLKLKTTRRKYRHKVRNQLLKMKNFSLEDVRLTSPIDVSRISTRYPD